jgi:hypothetical protein
MLGGNFPVIQCCYLHVSSTLCDAPRAAQNPDVLGCTISDTVVSLLLACRSRLQPLSTHNIGIEFYYCKYTYLLGAAY